MRARLEPGHQQGHAVDDHRAIPVLPIGLGHALALDERHVTLQRLLRTSCDVSVIVDDDVVGARREERLARGVITERGIEKVAADGVNVHNQQDLAVVGELQRRAGAGRRDRLLAGQELDPRQRGAVKRAKPDQTGDLPANWHGLGHEFQPALLAFAVKLPCRGIAPQ